MNIERISLDQLRVLVTTVNEGSFSAAARKLGRVQSAVTHTVQQLELQLGVELFDRSGYRPVLTPAGTSLMEDARAVLTRADSLLAKAGAISAGLESSLSITSDVMVPFDLLARVLGEFDTRFPGVKVQLQIEALGAVAAHLYEGVADLAILCSLPVPPDDLTILAMGHVSLVPVASSRHPLAAVEGRIDETALRDHRQIVLTDRSAISRGRDFNVYSPLTWRVADLGAKHALIRQGLGFGNMPVHLVQADLDAGALKALQLAGHPQGGDRLPMYLAHRPDRALGPAGQWIRERLALAAGPAGPGVPSAGA